MKYEYTKFVSLITIIIISYTAIYFYYFFITMKNTLQHTYIGEK